MAVPLETRRGRSGLKFDNVLRNQHLQAHGHAAPKATSTGTTIVGVTFKGVYNEQLPRALLTWA